MQENPYKAHREISQREIRESTISMSVGPEPANITPQKELTSAQLAALRLKEQNTMQLKVGAAAADAEDCEIYGGEYPEVDIEQQNEQSLQFS